MDDELIKRISNVTPKFNPSIANGLATEHMMHVNPETGVNNTMAYVDRLILNNRELFPEGLVYDGSQICSPIRHFEEVTKEYNSKRTANIARSDVYLVKYQFSFRGEPLFPRFILLPYVRDGGLITLNGATYNVSPVLTDVGFSALRGSIFIPFRRTKLTFNRETQDFYANEHREIVYVIWSMIHNEMSNRKKQDLDKRNYIHSCLAHYFFCKFGVINTFKRWGGADVEIGYRNDFPVKDYPRNQYQVFSSVKHRDKHPAGDTVLVIPKEQDNDFVRMLIGGFFYVLDAFPDRFVEPRYIDNIQLWRLLLGNLVFGDFEHAGKLLENIETHMHSFDNSLDEITREELKNRNIYVNNIWELLYSIMTVLSHHFYQTSHDEASMYSKKLVILRYVMEELNNAISLFSYGFQSRRDKEWSVNELNDALNRAFKLNTCIRKLTSEHGELDTVSYPGDNKFLKITSMLVPQDKARRSRGYGKGLISDASRLLHASIAEVGQFNNQPKNNPDGRSRINPYVAIDVDGTIRRRPEREALIELTQKRLSR